MSSIIGDCSCGPCGGPFFKIRQIVVETQPIGSETIYDAGQAGATFTAGLSSSLLNSVPWGTAPWPGPGMGSGLDWLTGILYQRDLVTGAWTNTAFARPVPNFYATPAIFGSNSVAAQGVDIFNGYQAVWSQVWTNCDVWFWLADHFGASICSGSDTAGNPLGYDCMPAGFSGSSIFSFALPPFQDFSSGSYEIDITYAMSWLTQGQQPDGIGMLNPCTGGHPPTC